MAVPAILRPVGEAASLRHTIGLSLHTAARADFGGLTMAGTTGGRFSLSADEYVARIEGNPRRRWNPEPTPGGGVLHERLLAVAKYGEPGVVLYFDQQGGFAGSTFHDSWLDGRSPEDRDSIQPADLLALNLLDERLRPRAIRTLLGHGRDMAAGFLAQIRSDIALWEDEAEHSLTWANAMWWWLTEADWIGEAIAGKLLARLRPQLIPMRDSVAAQILTTKPHTLWASLRRELRDPDVRSRLEALRPSDVQAPLIRVLDAAVWMLGSRAEAVRRQRGSHTRFGTARRSFWRALGEHDPADT